MDALARAGRRNRPASVTRGLATEDSPLYPRINRAIVGLILLSVVSVTLPRCARSTKANEWIFNLSELVVVTLFTIEYAINIYVAPDRKKYILGPWGIIDLRRSCRRYSCSLTCAGSRSRASCGYCVPAAAAHAARAQAGQGRRAAVREEPRAALQHAEDGPPDLLHCAVRRAHHLLDPGVLCRAGRCQYDLHVNPGRDVVGASSRSRRQGMATWCPPPWSAASLPARRCWRDWRSSAC